MAKKRLLRSQLITVRIPRELLKGIDLLALERERYRSEIILEAIQIYLRQDKAHRTAGRKDLRDQE